MAGAHEPPTPPSAALPPLVTSRGQTTLSSAPPTLPPPTPPSAALPPPTPPSAVLPPRRFSAGSDIPPSSYQPPLPPPTPPSAALPPRRSGAGADIPAVLIDRVSRSYGRVQAVRELSFAVHPGEVVGLLGPNGAGKTTTLRMLATLLKPDSGRIEVGGFDVLEAPQQVRAVLGYETGDTGLYKRLKPTEFLRYFGRLHSLEPKALEARIETLVADFQIGSFADRPCGNLSTGQQQRVSLARTLLHDPPVLVLDEPTRGLDILSSSFVLDTLKLTASRGKAVLFSTHIMSEVELTCDRVVVLHQGRCLADGTIASLLEQTGEQSLSRAFLALITESEATP